MEGFEKTSVNGGLLIQANDSLVEDTTSYEVVTEKQPTDSEMKALLAQWKIVNMSSPTRLWLALTNKRLELVLDK